MCVCRSFLSNIVCTKSPKGVPPLLQAQGPQALLS